MELRKYERQKITNTETFNDGIAYVYKIVNTAEPGFKPQYTPTLYRKFAFGYKTIGVKRNYEALQAQVKLDELIQILLDRKVSAQDIVVINEVQYQIKQVQHKKDTVPFTTLLSLVKLEEDYDDLGIR